MLIQTADIQTGARFYPVKPIKFVVLSLVTFGLYEMYWLYRCWQSVKQTEQGTIRPIWRAIFAPLWLYPLSRRIFSDKTAGLSIGIALTYFVLLLLAELPDPYWLASFLTILPLLPLVIRVNEINGAEMPSTYSRFGWKHLLVGIPGLALFLIGVMASFNLIPSSQVVDGSRITTWDMSYLRSIGAAEEGEAIIYFYSGGLLSISDDGNLFTDRRVVSYWYDSDMEQLFVEEAYYDEIESIETSYSTSFLEDTQIGISRIDGSWFVLIVSPEMGRDSLFVTRLNDMWLQKRNTIDRGTI